MALVYDENGRLVDDGLGPQGRPTLRPTTAIPPAVDPFARRVGGAGQPGAAPSITLTSGPRGTGATQLPAPSSLVPRFQFNTPAPMPAPSAAAAPTPMLAPVAPTNAASAEINAQTQQLADYRRETNALQTLAMERQNQLMADRALMRGEQAAPAAIPGVRGDYNLANTSTVDAAGNISSTLRQPVGAGLTFGFGENGAPSARQVLDRFAAQDQAAGEARRLRVAEARQQADLSRLRDLENDPVAYRKALAALQVTAPQLVGQREAVAQGADTRTRVAGELAAGEQRTEGALLQQLLENQARVEAANIAGQAAIGAQQARAQQAVGVELLKAQSPQGQNAAAQAQLRQLQLALATGALASGDTQTALAAATGGRPQQTRVATDALGSPIGVYDAAGNFIPYSPEQLAAVRAASGLTQGE